MAIRLSTPRAAAPDRFPQPLSVVAGALIHVTPTAEVPADDTLSADRVAMITVTPIPSVPAISAPISDGEATADLPSNSPVPRRRKPSLRAVDGHLLHATPMRPVTTARTPSESGGQRIDDTLACNAADSTHLRVGEAASVVSPRLCLPSPYAQTINAIRELHRQRQDLLRTEGDLTRRLKSICRRAVGYNSDAPDKSAKMAQANALFRQCMGGTESDEEGQTASDIPVTHADLSDPLDDAETNSRMPPKVSKSRASSPSCGEGVDVAAFSAPSIVTCQKLVKVERLKVERLMAKQAKMLPTYLSFVDALNGFGAIGFAQIIGECGDLSLYANPAKVWKRMGLALVGGERQRKCSDTDKAIAHGYSPTRRSTMFVIGDSLLKKQNPYKDLYNERKAYEVARAEANGLTVAPAAKIPRGKADQFMSQMHVHLRSQRYVEKRLLRDLWRAWRDQ